jgi:hypothetical protein
MILMIDLKFWIERSMIVIVLYKYCIELIFFWKWWVNEFKMYPLISTIIYLFFLPFTMDPKIKFRTSSILLKLYITRLNLMALPSFFFYGYNSLAIIYHFSLWMISFFSFLWQKTHYYFITFYLSKSKMEFIME